ncbi:GIY-YIG nuclease family protein [Ferrimonas balearica]|uniref:GIY-YIG nuclease family protein n=1 Tax=Ferrimonas balearica TaxID=44012 RepID=UPI001C9630E2|nr:GIY-YIG nuclease family protein [Ferrimonas balearica]MBY5980216.1 GIY-YIG nuclease family protein [Ferrimonas balearica]
MINGEVKFLIGNQVCVPDVPGVYVFYDISGPIYVGKSDSLHKRFQQHYEGSHNKALRKAISEPVGSLRFAWKVVDSVTETDEEEKRWIRKLGPAANLIRYVPKKGKKDD